jgi:hypothetical protein
LCTTRAPLVMSTTFHYEMAMSFLGLLVAIVVAGCTLTGPGVFERWFDGLFMAGFTNYKSLALYVRMYVCVYMHACACLFRLHFMALYLLSYCYLHSHSNASQTMVILKVITTYLHLRQHETYSVTRKPDESKLDKKEFLKAQEYGAAKVSSNIILTSYHDINTLEHFFPSPTCCAA